MKKKTRRLSTIITVIFIVLCTTAITAFSCVYSEITGSKGEEAHIPGNPFLILVNDEYHIPEDYEVNLLELSNGMKVDERIYPDLQQMFDDMRAQDMSPYVREGYRTADYQRDILIERIGEHIRNGYSPVEAYNITRDQVAAVGNSEHQLGLAVDINPYSGSPNEWSVYGWLAENAWEYGFILRYPEGKTEVTGITYEPWHYRYVGKDAAREIHERGITLEEYLNY